MSLSNPLQYSQLAPAAIEAAAKLVESITLLDYYKTNAIVEGDAFAIARWKAVSIGNLAATILQTIQFRDEEAGKLEMPGPKYAQMGATVDQEQRAFHIATLTKVPPCTNPAVFIKPANPISPSGN